MRGERTGAALLIALLLAVGALAWWLELRPSLQADATALSSLPARIGPWRATDIPVEAAIESVLRADFNLQRAYVTAGGDVIWFYLGYYGTERGGRPEHTPRGCYTGAGWGILAARTLTSARSDGLRVNEYSVERAGQRQLVHFWYRSHRRTGMLGGLDQNVDRMLARLLDGRADGALVRLSTPVTPGDEPLARGKLLSFGAALDPLLGERWPQERPAGAPVSAS